MAIYKRDEVEDLVDGLLFSDLQDTACLKWWEQHEATYLAKGPAGKALVALAKRWIWLLLSFPLIQSFITRYLTPPATSTAVERLFSAAGLIMDAKRNKLSPAFVDKLLFLREAHLLGICKLDWKWIVHMYFLNTLAQKYRLSTTVNCQHYLYFQISHCVVSTLHLTSPKVPAVHYSNLPTLYLYVPVKPCLWAHQWIDWAIVGPVGSTAIRWVSALFSPIICI